MTRFVCITHWPAALVFLLAGISAVAFAFVTVNLFVLAEASMNFIKRFGWEAIRHGALWQVGELVVSGVIAHACWLIFMIGEQELIERYLTWARRHGTNTTPRASLPKKKRRHAIKRSAPSIRLSLGNAERNRP